MRKLKHFAVLLCLFACLSAQAGQVTGVVQSAGGVALSNATLTWTPTQFAVVAGQFVQTAQSVNCYTDGSGNIIGFPNPLALPIASNGPLGSLTPGVYYVEITYTGAGGLESLPSPELAFTLSTNRLGITPPVFQPVSATGYKVYVGTTPGGETLQSTVVGFGTTLVNALVAGATPPVSNTSTCSFNFSDSLIPQARYVLSMVDSNGSSVPGWPQTYYTQGATFNLNTAVPTNGTTAIFPNAIVSTPSSGATQSILGGLNLNGFGLTAGSGTFSGNESVAGNATVGGTLGVTGNQTVGGNLSVTGVGNFKNLEAIMFADQYGNNTTTGIAGAIAAAGVVNKTNIWVPSSYATTETVPGSLPQWMFSGPGSLAVQGGNNAANITFQDNRFGRYFTALDPIGDKALYNPNVQQWFRWNENVIAGPSGQTFNNRTLAGFYMNALDGGFNFNNNGYANKENFAAIDARVTSFTPGQHVGIQSFNTAYSTGDQLSFFGQQACYGGFTANGDEGCESFDFESVHGNAEYTATIASGASTGATSLTLTPTAAGGTQGAYRFLIDITKIASAGTISAVTFTNATTPVAITGVGTSFGTSNVNTTLGTAVTAPGVLTVTPAAMTNITTASLLCIADPFTFEHVTPSATTGTTFTANFRYAHPTTTVVMAGGACGNYIELQADRATTATFGSTATPNSGGLFNNTGQVVNTLHYIIPMIGSTSNTAATIWLTNPNNGYVTYKGRWTSGGTNTYAIYPGAQVTSVQGATATCVNNSTCGSGNIGNVFTLEQNNAAWANADTVALPMYFSQNVSLGQMIYQNFFPQAGGTTLGALNIIAQGINQLGDSVIGITNSTPAALYTAGGGVLQPPYALTTVGSFAEIIRVNSPAPTKGIIAGLDGTNVTPIYFGELTGNQFSHNPTTQLFTFGNTGTGVQYNISAANGSTKQIETTAPSAATGNTVCYSDSTAHALECSYNNGSFFRQTQTIANGTATMTTAAIGAGACGTTVTVAATGVLTTDSITWSFNSAPAGSNAGLVSWPTANNVNFAYCPNSAETPAAETINWRVTR